MYVHLLQNTVKGVMPGVAEPDCHVGEGSGPQVDLALDEVPVQVYFISKLNQLI